jgi:dihydropyrimidinase
VTGWPVTTVVRGQVVVENGVLAAEKGVGRFLKRGKSAFVPD